jgi:hypothetical protein
LFMYGWSRLRKPGVEVAAMLVPAIVEVLAGFIVLWLAVRMWQGRVARGSAAGVRTPSTVRSDAAFETANKAAREEPRPGRGGPSPHGKPAPPSRCGRSRSGSQV